MPVDVRLTEPAAKQFAKAPEAVRRALRAAARKLAADPQAGEYVPRAQVPNKRTLKA